MLELSWDQELAAVAQRLADQCVFSHDCAECRSVARFRSVHWFETFLRIFSSLHSLRAALIKLIKLYKSTEK